jgi:hypothetical protein
MGSRNVPFPPLRKIADKQVAAAEIINREQAALKVLAPEPRGDIVRRPAHTKAVDLSQKFWLFQFRAPLSPPVDLVLPQTAHP